jgi:7-cyano-7-deazaguanine synthase in queuosine biosynthesis
MRELTPDQLAAKVAQAPVLRRAPGLRDEIVRALERVQELERDQVSSSTVHAALDSLTEERDRWRQRAERLEAAAREAAFCRRPEPVRDRRAPEGWATADCGKCSGCRLRAALVGASAEEGGGGR